MRIFMPADSPHLNLCKAVMSAVALGYPLPTLLNWDGEYNRQQWHFAGSHIAKLESLLGVIDELLNKTTDDGGADKDDLAIMVDAYDIWFQLPPHVLIERFYDLNRQANERLESQWSAAIGMGHPVPASPPKQSIVVTSAKDCSPDWESGSHPHYDHWPESPMPADMYGPGTDRLAAPIWDPARKYRKIRPRCVNSGMIMGTMGAMRSALVRCKEKAERAERMGRELWSDQALFAEVIGEQEMFREWMRGVIGAWNGTEAVTQPDKLKPEVRRVAQQAMLGTNFEFGIGLDYTFSTIPPTCSAEEDGYFVKTGNITAIEEASIKARVPGEIRVSGPPAELERPLASTSPLRDVLWADVPLYTDFYFGITPVGIHHNAYVMGLKPWRIRNWWDKMWFHPNLRKLVIENLRLDASSRILAELGANGDNPQVVYKHPEASSNTVTVFKQSTNTTGGRFVPISWDGVCQKGGKPWYDELFGDGQGRFEF